MTICPVCSHSLLRHISHQKAIWFCSSCRQEMPDLDALGLLDTSKDLLKKIETRLNQTKIKTPQYSWTKLPNTLILEERLSSLDWTISENQKRLNLVDLIINKTQSIVTHGIADLVANHNESIELEAASLDDLIRACCSDADTILWYICYAILCRDPLVLDNHYLKSLQEVYNNIGITNDKVIRMINLMKAYVLSLVKDKLFGVRDSIAKEVYTSLGTEIANYFDRVITSIDN